MKFSWRSLNYFINLNNITIDKLTELLTIKGFEIDNIDKYINFNDYVLDISITANRQDIFSVIGLATELGYILNQNIKNKYTILQYQINHNNIYIINQSKIEYLAQIKINKIINLKNYSSPLWIINYLKIHDIQPQNLIIDIKEYIKIKWGHEINIFNIKDTINSINSPLQIEKHTQYEEIKYNNISLIQIFKNQTCINHDFIYNNNTTSIIVCSHMYNYKYLKNVKNTYNTRDNMNGYYEALQLIATYGKACISKSYSYTNNDSNHKYNLNIHKNLIQNTLGPINNKSKYLKQNTIYQILKQLEFKPEYNYYNKNFKVTIPQYRLNDLYRSIDIIEEIGRIYGYQNFIDSIPCINHSGNLSKQYQVIKYIRQYFRDIGLHEIINSSLEKNNVSQSHLVNIYNPLLLEQSTLRQTLLDNVIRNKIYNYKQKNNNIEIFEIGKVFHKNIKTNTHKEKIYIAGILSNTTFIKQSWGVKPSNLTWFHAKGTMEQFFEKLQIPITWCPIDKFNKQVKQDFTLNNFDLQNTICIYNKLNHNVIGLMGLINHKIYKEIPNNEIINIFELSIENLIKNYYKKSHLSYIFHPYSVYPSVIRDISIKINKNLSITTIQLFIYNLNTTLIKKVEVFNQYQDIKSLDKKCVGIRITYNSKYRTLNQNDLQIIEQNINFILQNYEST